MNLDQKKRKYEEDGETQLVMRQQDSSSSSDEKRRKLTTSLMELPPRSSNLSSPILKLDGHKSEVFTCKFSNSGNFLASGSADKSILLWDVFNNSSTTQESEDSSSSTTINYGSLLGHKNAVLDLDWLPSEDRICTASADNSVILWDTIKCLKVRQFKNHSSIVNCCSTSKSLKSPDLFVSGGDDRVINVYDQRERKCIKTIKSKYPIFSICFSENNDRLFSCGVDSVISAWDFKTDKFLYNLGSGQHTDSITDIKLSPDGNFLLSNSMDGTCRVWDCRHYAESTSNSNNGSRCVKVFMGSKHSMDKNLVRVAWYKDSSLISTGSENDVMIWNTTTRRIEYQLPGHLGNVNCVHFHPQQPIIASASSDKSIYLGEINPKSIY